MEAPATCQFTLRATALLGTASAIADTSATIRRLIANHYSFTLIVPSKSTG